MDGRMITVTVEYEALLNARVALSLIADDESYTPEEHDREELARQKSHLDAVVRAYLETH